MGKFGDAHAYMEDAMWTGRWPSTNQRVRPGTDSSLIASEGTILSNTLILNLISILILILPPELGGVRFLLFKLPSYWYRQTNTSDLSFVVVPGFEPRQVSLDSSAAFLLVSVSISLSLLAPLALITLSPSSSLLSFCHSLSLSFHHSPT